MTLTTTTTHSVPVSPTSGALRPLGLDEVTITGGFWARRQEVNGRATIAHIGGWLEREGWLGNFDLAASGALPEGRRGREFSDSEVYKYLEAIAWEIGRRTAAGLPTDELEARFRAVVARVAAAQEPDGYLNTRFGRPGQGARWSDLEWGHELYCLGHLFQAAVARVRTRPDADDGLVDVARRAADLVCEVFGEGRDERICGHAEVEVGLAELGRALGEPRYLEQARLFVERHGQGTLRDIEWGRSYYQDDQPVRDADVLRGHSVRANYLAAGAADVAIETGDDELLHALDRQWDTTVERRTYVTGGQGSHHQDEAFGEDWELPSDRAYSETCAGVASVMFSWRLLLAQGDARYADLIERTLFNVIETSPSSRGHRVLLREHAAPAASGRRCRRRHGVAAGAVVAARTLVRGVVLPAEHRPHVREPRGVHRDGGCRRASSCTSTRPRRSARRSTGGQAVALEVATEYPRSGSVRVRVLTDAAEPWTLSLRVPAWAEGARAVVRPADGGPEQVLDADPHGRPGTVSLERAFAAGDEVELVLPVAPRFAAPDPRVDAVRGCLVVERGPEVFALESVDLAGTELAASDFADLRVDPDVAPRDDADGSVVATIVDERTGARAEVPLVRYHDWAERGPSQMRVWVPVVGA